MPNYQYYDPLKEKYGITGKALFGANINENFLNQALAYKMQMTEAARNLSNAINEIIDKQRNIKQAEIPSDITMYNTMPFKPMSSTQKQAPQQQTHQQQTPQQQTTIKKGKPKTKASKSKVIGTNEQQADMAKPLWDPNSQTSFGLPAQTLPATKENIDKGEYIPNAKEEIDINNLDLNNPNLQQVINTITGKNTDENTPVATPKIPVATPNNDIFSNKILGDNDVLKPYTGLNKELTERYNVYGDTGKTLVDYFNKLMGIEGSRGTDFERAAFYAGQSPEEYRNSMGLNGMTPKPSDVVQIISNLEAYRTGLMKEGTERSEYANQMRAYQPINEALQRHPYAAQALQENYVYYDDKGQLHYDPNLPANVINDLAEFEKEIAGYKHGLYQLSPEKGGMGYKDKYQLYGSQPQVMGGGSSVQKDIKPGVVLSVDREGNEIPVVTFEYLERDQTKGRLTTGITALEYGVAANEEEANRGNYLYIFKPNPKDPFKVDQWAKRNGKWELVQEGIYLSSAIEKMRQMKNRYIRHWSTNNMIKYDKYVPVEWIKDLARYHNLGANNGALNDKMFSYSFSLSTSRTKLVNPNENQNSVNPSQPIQ